MRLLKAVIIISSLSPQPMGKERAPKTNTYVSAKDLAHGHQPPPIAPVSEIIDLVIESYPPSPIYLSHQRYDADGEPRLYNYEQKAQALERQGYVCPICGQGVAMKGSQSHHCVQVNAGGRTTMENLTVVHTDRCHAEADRRAMSGDMVVGGSIFDATEEQAKRSLLDILLRRKR